MSCLVQPYERANRPRVLAPLSAYFMEQHPDITAVPWIALHDMVRRSSPGVRPEGADIDWSSFAEHYKSVCPEHGYGPTSPITWIGYVDANSLYPTAMNMHMPIGWYCEMHLGDPLSFVMELLNTYDYVYAEVGYVLGVTYCVPAPHSCSHYLCTASNTDECV